MPEKQALSGIILGRGTLYYEEYFRNFNLSAFSSLANSIVRLHFVSKLLTSHHPCMGL